MLGFTSFSLLIALVSSNPQGRVWMNFSKRLKTLTAVKACVAHIQIHRALLMHFDRSKIKEGLLTTDPPCTEFSAKIE